MSNVYGAVELSTYAQLILECIAKGFRLRVPYNSPAELVVLPYLKGSTMSDSIGPLEREPVKELIFSGVLQKLTKEDVHQRMGWESLGFDGTKADFYCMVQ